MKKLTYFLLLSSLWMSGQTQTPAFVSDSLDSYIEEGMKDWNIPGLSIAIIKDGEVVKMKGYGVRDVESQEPVDENTLFIIASNTKLMTGTALANLDHEEKLSLDDQVTDYLPDFRLYDSTATELVSIRDLLSHRMGLKTFHGDFVNWNSNLSREEIVENMRLLKPTGEFRHSYGYSNSGFVTAGMIIPEVTGKTWEEYVTETIFEPLGMNNTYALIAGVGDRKNVAKPYTDAFKGQLTKLPYDKIDNLGPAGGVVSNVKDVSKWLMMQLDSGSYQGRRILPWEVLQETRDVNTIITSRKHEMIPNNFIGYGLGVTVSDYNGRMLYRHTGGVFGFLTNTSFVPEENLAITIMTNNDNQSFFEMLRLQILDSYLEVPFTNRSKNILQDHLTGLKKTKQEIAVWEKRVGEGQPEFAISAYEGTYENDLYGTVHLKAVNDRKLEVDFERHDDLVGTLEYMSNGEWLLSYNNIDYGIFAIQFEVEEGRVKGIPLRVSDYVDYDTYNFAKK